jgi:hypothetical protein
MPRCPGSAGSTFPAKNPDFPEASPRTSGRASRMLSVSGGPMKRQVIGMSIVVFALLVSTVALRADEVIRTERHVETVRVELGVSKMRNFSAVVPRTMTAPSDNVAGA